MKFRIECVGFALTLGLAAASASQAQTAETPTTIPAAHTAILGDLTLTGNQQGQALLTNKQTGVTTVFRADPNKWAREVFLLDGGKVLAASQPHDTVFWNAASHLRIGRIEARVYGFSHNQKLFFAQTADHRMQLYAYPSLRLLGNFSEYSRFCVNQFVFSPDDHYLLAEHRASTGEAEANYPNRGFVFKEKIHAVLYDLVKIAEVEEFNRYRVAGLGAFSPDSRAINFGDVYSLACDQTETEATTWQYDIAAGTLTKTQ